MGEPRISVIIPVRNEADKLEQCLTAVLAQSLKAHEVIVVDGHSIDGTVERAKRFPVKILYEDYHTRAGACQIGVENAGGEYVAFTDADCRPDRDWLANLVKAFDDGIVGVGGMIKQLGEETWIRSVNLVYGTFLGSANSVQGRCHKTKRVVNSISGSNSMYLKQNLVKVGGFKVKLPGGEDAEINKRLLRHGHLLYTPDAIIQHEHGRSLKSFARQMYLYGTQVRRSNIWTLQSLPPLIVPLLFVSLVFTRWFFPAMLGIYLLLLISMALKFSIQEKSAKYMITIPITYITEHVSYTAGFWKGMVRPPKQREVGK